MSANIVTAIYIAASVLFILSLGGLSNQESAKRAVWYGIVGMALAVGATIFGPHVAISNILILMIVIGSVIGLVVARRVEMTGMPQLVAALHTSLEWRLSLLASIQSWHRRQDSSVQRRSFMRSRCS